MGETEGKTTGVKEREWERQEQRSGKWGRQEGRGQDRM